LSFTTLGACANEVGCRAFKLHIQAVFEIHAPKNELAQKEIRQSIKVELPFKGQGYKVKII